MVSGRLLYYIDVLNSAVTLPSFKQAINIIGNFFKISIKTQ